MTSLPPATTCHRLHQHRGQYFQYSQLLASRLHFLHILCFNVSCQEGGASKIKMVLIGPKFAKISICLHCCMKIMECQQCSSKFTSRKNSPPDGFYQRILPVIPPCGWPLGSEGATVTQWKSLQQLGIWICANSLVTWPRCSDQRGRRCLLYIVICNYSL